MSAVRLTWLMGSRGVLFAVLAFVVMGFVVAPTLELGHGVPVFSPYAGQLCYFGCFGTHPSYCSNIGNPLLGSGSLLAPVILILGLFYGIYGGFQQWRTGARPGW